jgi:hypothetical protein
MEDLTKYTSTYVNRFDFYSGSQITVWFGNIMIDDISSIQWVRQQNKMPIFGYASQYFDAVANGIVTIQGSFVINFRQQGYLPAVIQKIKDLYKVYNSGSSESKINASSSQWPVVKELISAHLRNGTFGPQTAQDIQDLGNSPDFFETVKIYEEFIWGNTISSAENTLNYEPPDVKQAKEISDGFNILISYGDPTYTTPKTMTDYMQSTVKMLDHVHLLGQAQMIQVGGQPVQEQYNFIARSTDAGL